MYQLWKAAKFAQKLKGIRMLKTYPDWRVSGGQCVIVRGVVLWGINTVPEHNINQSQLSMICDEYSEFISTIFLHSIIKCLLTLDANGVGRSFAFQLLTVGAA